VAEELSLGVVSRVGPGIGVLGGGGCAQEEGIVFGVSSRDLDSNTVGSRLHRR